MNINEIITSTDKALERATQKIDARRKKMAAVRKAIKAWEDDKYPMLKHRKNLWFSTTQTKTSKRIEDISCQYHGTEVGLLICEKHGQYLFKPLLDEYIEPNAPTAPWKWSHDAKDAQAIRKYIDNYVPKLNDPSNEREIQWQLAEALLKTGKADSLRKLQNVTWKGRFTEIGVAIPKEETRSNGTGTIDLLVKRRGGKSGAGFLVFEVKKPSESDVEATLIQAMRYAMCLHKEANKNDFTKTTYRKVFGSNGANNMSFGAVIVMHNNDKVNQQLRKHSAEIQNYNKTFYINKIVDRIGVLLYDFDSAKVTNWHWYMHGEYNFDPR